MILEMQNATSNSQNSVGTQPTGDVAERIARQTLANRAPDYSSEVRRLLDAGRDVMGRCGTTSRPRVADIVAAAGLSNDAFYRYFPSKDVLVAAIVEDGAERLRSYLVHQMAKERSPEDQVRRWVGGVMGQAADEEIAATTLAVMWNSGNLLASGSSRPSVSAPLALLLRDPFTALGSPDPDLDAALAGHAVVGRLTDHLWEKSRPTKAETAHLVAFCVRAGSGSSTVRPSG